MHKHQISAVRSTHSLSFRLYQFFCCQPLDLVRRPNPNGMEPDLEPPNTGILVIRTPKGGTPNTRERVPRKHLEQRRRQYGDTRHHLIHPLPRPCHPLLHPSTHPSMHRSFHPSPLLPLHLFTPASLLPSIRPPSHPSIHPRSTSLNPSTNSSMNLLRELSPP